MNPARSSEGLNTGSIRFEIEHRAAELRTRLTYPSRHRVGLDLKLNFLTSSCHHEGAAL